MPAWATPGLTLSGFRTHQLEALYLDMGVVTPGGSTVTVQASHRPALLYAFVYGCHPCPATQGGLIGHLLSQQEEWRLGYCAPWWHNARDGQSYRMLSFAKDVPAFGSYTLTIPDDVEYLAFIAVEDVLQCPDITDPDQCNTATITADERCRWNALAETCEFAYCTGNTGPSRTLCNPDACAPAADSFFDVFVDAGPQ